MSRGDSEKKPAEDRRSHLKSQIRELGAHVDSNKARTAAHLGGGVFLLLLAAVTIHDLVRGKTSIWQTVGVSREVLHWLGGLLAIGGLVLLLIGIAGRRGADRVRQSRLAALEDELSELEESDTEPP